MRYSSLFRVPSQLYPGPMLHSIIHDQYPSGKDHPRTLKLIPSYYLACSLRSLSLSRKGERGDTQTCPVLDLGVIQDTQLAWVCESNTGMVEYRSISYNSDGDFLESEGEPMAALLYFSWGVEYGAEVWDVEHYVEQRFDK